MEFNEKLLSLVVKYREQVAFTLEKRSEFQLLGPDSHPVVAEQQHQIKAATALLAEIDAVLAGI